MKVKLGQRVEFNDTKLIRITRSEERKTWKVWEESPFSCGTAIFLGWRYLKNGIICWDEDRYIFHEKERIKAALVCWSDKANPIYVPADYVTAAQ